MFDAVYLVSVALLRGLELRYGRHSVKLRYGRIAYSEAVRFVQEVGEGRAVHRGAPRARGRQERKGQVAVNNVDWKVPDWVESFISKLTECAETINTVAWRIRPRADDGWEVDIAPSLYQNSQGKRIFDAEFIVHVNEVLEMLDEDDYGGVTLQDSAVYIVGEYQGNDVLISLRTMPWEEAEPIGVLEENTLTLFEGQEVE